MSKTSNAVGKVTLKNINCRVVSAPLNRPVVAKVGTFTHWPFSAH